MDSGQVMEKRSVSVGFALPAKKMIRLLPGSTLASVRAPQNGFTRSIQVIVNVKVQTVNLSFLGLYSAVGRRETEREQQHGCRLSSMWRRLYHPGPNSRLNTRNLNIFVLSSLPLLRFSVCWMPWTSWSSPSILSITKFKYWAPVKNNRNLPGWPIVPCCCWWCVCRITVLDLRHLWGCHSNAGRKPCLSSEWRSKICKEALSLDMI